MYRLLFLLLLASLASVPAAAQSRAIDRVFQDNCSLYRERLDQMLARFLRDGVLPDHESILRLQAMEMDLTSMAALQPAFIPRLPTMELSALGALSDLRHLPGALLANRARRAGLDPLHDTLNGRSFAVASPPPKR